MTEYSNTLRFRYPNRGGGLGIRTSLDKICSDSESIKGFFGIIIWIRAI